MDKAGAMHAPVLAEAVVALLDPSSSQVVADVTFGHGGHSLLLAERMKASSMLIALDRDPAMAAIGEARLLERFPGGSGPRFVVRAVSYERIGEVVAEVTGGGGVDVLLADLGVNSRHLDDASRGFAFSQSGPLDMRFNPAEGGPTAADLVNEASEAELTRVLREYGEERLAARIAGRIVARRKQQPFETTTDLAGVIAAAYPPKTRWEERIHPATRSFQAIRIAVNRELEAVEQGMAECLRVLRPGGRMGVISFHSLESRIVKNLFRSVSAPRPDPTNPFQATTMKGVEFEEVVRGAISCSEEEAERNPRARSAQLRVIRRKEAAGQ